MCVMATCSSVLIFLSLSLLPLPVLLSSVWLSRSLPPFLISSPSLSGGKQAKEWSGGVWEEGVGGARDERRDERRDMCRTNPPTAVEGEEQEEERRRVSGERKEVASVKEEVSGPIRDKEADSGSDKERNGRGEGGRKSMMRRGRDP